MVRGHEEPRCAIFFSLLWRSGRRIVLGVSIYPDLAAQILFGVWETVCRYISIAIHEYGTHLLQEIGREPKASRESVLICSNELVEIGRKSKGAREPSSNCGRTHQGGTGLVVV